eukprot:TRINITY_DN5968_c0_g1_i1.p1 TRINITY_DN5968_c0_g1~~TRINITY_DN5968_c0_g1_i1.p1  ORF type:complete len:121 (-),score=31.74 TRINITY_DN5968_c0_g1_i1:196-558(-)
MPQQSAFRSEHTFEKRLEVAGKIRSKYPDRIPVIVEKASKSNAPEIDKKKFLVPADLTVSKLAFEIRRHLKLSPEHGMFLFINDTLPPNAAVLQQIYDKYKNADGFLYVTYASENTFGGL